MSWLRCSACKRDITWNALHWVCSVSTCNRHNTNYKFCTVACWDSHVATLRHRDAWAVEARAPSKEGYERERDLTSTVDARPATRPTPAPIARPAPAPIARPAVGPAAPPAPIARPTIGPAAAPAPIARPAATSPAELSRPAIGPGASAEPARRLVPVPVAPAAPPPITFAEAEDEVLIVVSKMKKYIRERAGMNTSDAVADELSEHVRAICDEAIRTAAADGRKTVLDRDVPRVKR